MPEPLLIQLPGDWCAAIAALPAAGALPLRTVLVSSERHAHVLRRALVRAKQAHLLAGTRFVGPATLAEEVVLASGRGVRLGEGALRPARLQALFARKLALAHHDLDLLRSTPGWPDAFAAAIGDLEAAGLTPDALPTSSPQWADLALLWRAVDAAGGRSWTQARLYLEAEALLLRGARPLTGPVLAAVTGRETAAQARFIRALPDLHVAVVAARPVRRPHLERLEALFGREAASALSAAPPPPPGETERAILVHNLFATPEALADRRRPRSAGPDGTVALEEHAGVEAELAAAVEWVAHQVLERSTPLEEIALLAPHRDPVVPLLAARLARLELPGGALPVHVAGGLAAAATAGGARALTLLRALSAYLPADGVAALLPALRAPIGDRTHLSTSEAIGLAWSLGTLGGSAVAPQGALEWSSRASRREARLAAALAGAGGAGANGERERWQLEAKLAPTRAALPALEALTALARLVVEDRPLAELAPAVVGFTKDWLLDPSADAPVHALLAGALDWVAGDALGAEVRGRDAVLAILARLEGLCVGTARFGTPAVFVGTVAEAQGLSFEAVRVLGLCEGSIPSSVREDPVLPDAMRREASPLLATSADRVLGQLHAFDLAARAATGSLALSAPRSDTERSEREASSLLIDVGAALGRPDPLGGGAIIPDLTSLERTAFGPARADACRARDERPATPGEWLDRAAARAEVPASWAGEPHLDLPAILSLRDRTSLGPADGLVGTAGPLPPIPGIAPERPTSASALGTLLACPCRFLYERILRWGEPAGGAPVSELDALTYGGLFHEVMEAFGLAHGQAFVERGRTLAHWKAAAAALADERFDALLDEVPFVGPAAVEQQRQRLRRDVTSFLEYDWKLPLSRLVAVERSFGTPEPFVHAARGVKLHLRGFIDRLDVEGRHLLLRDYKTGRDHPRDGDEAGPTMGRDLQLGLYGLVARRLARAWGVPAEVRAAYVYPRSGEERAFRDDFGELEAAARDWLAVGAQLLDDAAFPPTPATEDCSYCPFKPLCGDDVPARAARGAGTSDAVDAFLSLRGVIE